MNNIPRAALDAAGNALRARWLGELPNVALPSYGLDPMEWAATALEAAMPHLTMAPVIVQVSGKLDETSMAQLREKLQKALREAAS